MTEEWQVPEWLNGDRGLGLFIVIAIVVACLRIIRAILLAKKQDEKIKWGELALDIWDGLGLTILLCIGVSSLILVAAYLFSRIG